MIPAETTVAKCAKCGQVFEEPTRAETRLPCPSCGSTTRVIEVSLTGSLELHGSIGYKQKRPGYKKPIAEGKSGDSFWHDTGLWMHRSFSIDRLTKRIRENIVDPKTGQVLKEYDDPLDKHTGHGDAKKLNKPNN